jgi:DNA mismatch repair protein MutS
MQNATPMLRQYLEIKKNYPGTLLFFRLGDFYELFNEDAIIASREMEITLTARHKDSANPIPMCGVPHHAAANYIAKLVKKGYRVAICEQTELAGKDVKLVRREVVRVITPGTAIDPQLLETKESIYLAAVAGSGETFGIAFLELSTGEFFTTEISGKNSWSKTCADIESFAPRELLFPESLTKLVENSFSNFRNPTLSDASNVVSISSYNSAKFTTTLTPLDDWLFHTEDCENTLKNQLKVRELTAFGLENKHEAVRASGAVLRYALDTQKAAAEHISEINILEANDFMVLDAVTLRNLEIIESKGESNKKTLLNVIDETVTGMGARLLRSWLLRPSVKRSEIQTRLSAVSELTDSMLRDKIRYLLKEIADLERLVGRLNLGTTTPRDLIALCRSISQTPNINATLSDAQSLLLQVLSENIFELPDICSLISRSISDEPPLNFNDGGVIRDGFNEDLDELRNISTSAKQIIASFEEAERQRTGIFNLKIKFNNVFGYFIEISKGNISRVPDDYERRQTLTNAERYTTPQLKEWEEKVLGAEEKMIQLETEIFQNVRSLVREETQKLQSTARALATLDALASLAQTAERRNYVCPTLHDGDEIELKTARHPIVEAFLKEDFIPNDLYLNNSTDRLLIITGPNMGGKCLRGDSLIFTSNGLMELSELKPADSTIKEFIKLKKTNVKTRLGIRTATHFYNGGRQKTLRLKTRYGFEIEGTAEHRLWVRKKDGSEDWCYFSDLAVGDVVAIERKIDLWGKRISLKDIEFELDHRAKRYKLPEILDEDLGYLLGLLVGDGTTTYKNSFLLTTADESIFSEFQAIIFRLFGYKVKQNKRISYLVSSKQIRLFLENLGLGYEKSIKKYVPKRILTAPKRIVIAFLQGLFDTDGWVANHQSKVFYASSSEKLARQIQMILLNLGIVSSLTAKKTNRNPSYKLGIYGEEAIRFHNIVGFRLERKNNRRLLAPTLRMPNLGIPNFSDILKNIQHRIVATQNKSIALKKVKSINSIFYTYLPNGRNISYRKLQELIDYCKVNNVLCNDLENVNSNKYFYDTVKSIENSEADVFDLSVADDHSYIANGFISHNSTILRQLALIQILAQIGSFVPANSAKLPMIDRVWTRVGASDDLSSGRSTFMVEMTETAAILHNATPKSLILLDEIGRGTSTFDGLSIAWAVAEYLHNSPEHSAKTLFATHYHELTELAENLPGAKNYQVLASEKDGDVVFLHKLQKGKASKSYGIAVAKLAGLPNKVIEQAKSVLAKLEKYELAVFSEGKQPDGGIDKAIDRAKNGKIASQFSLFAISNETVIDEIREFDIEKMSADEIKLFLSELKKKII